MSGFLQALPFVLRVEGGYADDPDDPGGATMRGVTQATFDAFRATLRLEPKPVAEITDDEVHAIYHRRYWMDARCDALPWPVSLAHFDAAVNHGTNRAARLLQQACGATADGIIGPKTLAAVSAMPLALLVSRMLFERLAFYELITIRNRRFRKFLLGWLSRVNALRHRVRADLPEVA